MKWYQRLCIPLLLALSACTAWHTKPLAPTADVAYYADPARVQLRDGRTLDLTDVRVAGDSLSGVPKGTAHAYRITVAVHDVASLRVNEPSPQRTIVVGILLIVGYVTLLAVGSR